MKKMICYSLNKSIIYLGFLLLFFGCTPVHIHQEFSAEEKFPQEYSGDILPSPDTQAWQESFPSINLYEDVRKLTGQNHELEAAAARVEQAAAAYNIDRSSLFPSIDAAAGFDRSRTGGNGSGDRRGSGNILSFSGIMNWELDVWGALRAKEKAATLTLMEKKALLGQKKIDLQDLLVRAWITFHTAKRLESVLKEQQKTNLKFLALTKTYFNQGQGSTVDILQQRGRLLATEKAIPEIINKKSRAANTYAVLMGTIPDGSDLADDDLPHIKKLSRISSPSNLFNDRPDLRAGFFALQSADHNLAASIAERLPRFSIGASYGRTGQSFSSVESETVLSLAGNLIAPVFNAGRLKAKVSQRKAEVYESLAVLEQAVLEAVQEVEDALYLELRLFEKQEILKRQILNARKTLDNARLFYLNGKEPYITVLSSLISLQNLQVDEIELQEELLINRCRLLKALGAGWSNQHESY